MRNWLYLHTRAVSRALARLARQPFGTLLSALVMGIALTLPAGGMILLDHASTLARGVSGKPEISLFLNDDASPAQTDAIRQNLQAEAQIEGIRFVPRDVALKQLENNGLGDVLGGIAANPLPDAFVVTLKGDDPALFDTLSTKMRNWAGIAHVQIDSAWVKRLAALLELVRVTIWVLSVLLGLALAIVTFNTIRLQILTQENEIEVSRLLGATDRFIRRPFYWFGTLQGVLGGLIAVGAVWAGFHVLSAPIAKVGETWGMPVAPVSLNGIEGLAIVAAAAALGWLGTAISVRRYLTM
ncbi:MAG: permease-like cell division protein FtsX [Azoarcus sp.]|nr:permease-like cell division protein FtsX [Azoarcus sp.]